MSTTETFPVAVGPEQLQFVGNALSGAQYKIQPVDDLTRPVLSSNEIEDWRIIFRRESDVEKAQLSVNASVVAILVGSMHLAASDENSRPVVENLGAICGARTRKAAVDVVLSRRHPLVPGS